MKLCGFDVGLDRPLFLIAGPCVVESRAAADRRRRRAEGDLRDARHPVHLQVVATTRRTAARHESFRGPGMDEGLRDACRKCEAQVGVPVLTDVHDGRRRSGRGRGRRRAADAGVPVPPDRFHPGRRRAASRSTSRRASSWRPRTCCRSSPRRRPRAAPTTSWSASAARRSAITTSSPTCARSRSCARPAARSCSTRRTRCSCRAGRARRPAGSASSCPCWRAPRLRRRRRRVHGNASGSGEGAVRRPECVAAARDAGACSRRWRSWTRRSSARAFPKRN